MPRAVKQRLKSTITNNKYTIGCEGDGKHPENFHICRKVACNYPQSMQDDNM